MIGEELYDAASKGDATKFQQLLQQDPYLVERVSFPCSRNPLHIATMRGQVAIVEEVLKISPELALDLDSKNSSSLHIVAAKGNVEIAKRLLLVAPEMCWCRDGQGLNPVHVAAIKGHVGMLEVLLGVDPFPAMERVHRGQTVLHLCVRHNQLRALQFLVGKLGDLVYAKDDDGETLLHWAARSKQVEVIEFLAKHTKINKASQNSVGKTAEEIFAESPFHDDISNVEYIRKILSPKYGQLSSQFDDILTKKREQTMVVMALIATMAFQAAVSPPGGVWQDDTSSHRAGKAVMASTHPNIYKHLIHANTIAFVSSLFTLIFVFIFHHDLEKGFLLDFSSYILWVSLASIGVSYGGSVMVTTPNTEAQSFSIFVIVVFIISVSFVGLLIRASLERWYELRQYRRRLL